MSRTTYRLTEHFHFWTKHALINAILQPEEFIEIGEVLAQGEGDRAGRLGARCPPSAASSSARPT